LSVPSLVPFCPVPLHENNILDIISHGIDGHPDPPPLVPFNPISVPPLMLPHLLPMDPPNSLAPSLNPVTPTFPPDIPPPLIPPGSSEVPIGGDVPPPGVTHHNYYYYYPSQ